MNRIATFISLFLICLILGYWQYARHSQPGIKAHEQWWSNCLESKVSLKLFKKWLGGQNAESRIAMRRHIKEKGYSSILDVPCGLCVDYSGIKEENLPIQYTGLDITKKLVKNATRQGISAVLGSIERIPFEDNHFDICYARHILEHLDSYVLAVPELIRAAKKEVMIVFFLKPTSEAVDKINASPDRGFLLYHNQYSKPKLEEFVLANSKVHRIDWEEVGMTENILHIYLK